MRSVSLGLDELESLSRFAHGSGPDLGSSIHDPLSAPRKDDLAGPAGSGMTGRPGCLRPCQRIERVGWTRSPTRDLA